MRSRRQVPFVIVGVSLAVIVVASVIALLGGSRVGATWDERAHVGMLQTYFDTGWNVGPDWLVDGDLDPFTGKWPYFVYAPVASLLAHLGAVLTGNEPWGGSSLTADAFAARHIAIGLIAILGVVAVGGVVRLITRSWAWATVGAALLASTPMWIGHGMFNVKDLPVGTGYTMATLGLVAICRRDYARSPRLRLLAWGAVVAGLVLAVGTRPASGLGVALTGMGLAVACVVLFILSGRHPRLQRWGLKVRLIDVVGSLVLAYLVLIAIYPKGFANPFRLAKETLLISGRFPVSDAELTNGVWLSQPPPWYYLPTWFGAQATLLVLVGCLLFAVAWIAIFVRLVRTRGRGHGLIEAVVLPVPVIAQALLMAALAVAAQSTIYDAMRQFLFIPPAAAVLAALGIRAGIRRLNGHRVASGVAWAVVGVGLVLPVVDQVRLFPYNYVYFNEIASLKPIDGNWATDYWRASGRDLVRIVPPGETSCILIEPDEPARPCDQDATFAPFWADRGADALSGDLGTGEYWLVRENNGDLRIPAGCSLHDEITRPLRSQEVTIIQVLRCPLPVGS